MGIPIERVKEQLDDLFFKAVAFPEGSLDERKSFRLARINEIHDGATVWGQTDDPEKDRILLELWHDFCLNEWYFDIGKILLSMYEAANERPIARIVPSYRAIKDPSQLLPCEDIRELLKVQELIAVIPCACRYITSVLGKTCPTTNEAETWHCIWFWHGAETVIKRGVGKALSIG